MMSECFFEEAHNETNKIKLLVFWNYFTGVHDISFYR